MGPRTLTSFVIALVLSTVTAGVLLVDIIHNTLRANVLTNALFVANGCAVLAWLYHLDRDRETTARDQHASGRMSGLKSTTSSREN